MNEYHPDSKTAASITETDAHAEIISVGEKTVVVRANPHPFSELNGEDAYEARLREFPGLVAYGSTVEQAKELVLQQADSDFARATGERRNRLQAIQAQVQFNHRISPEEKATIVQRAESSRLSVRQFMLNQCIHAPVWDGYVEKPLSTEQQETMLRAIAKRGADRKQRSEPKDG
jgi:hypothetical protein